MGYSVLREACASCIVYISLGDRHVDSAMSAHETDTIDGKMRAPVMLPHPKSMAKLWWHMKLMTCTCLMCPAVPCRRTTNCFGRACCASHAAWSLSTSRSNSCSGYRSAKAKSTNDSDPKAHRRVHRNSRRLLKGRNHDREGEADVACAAHDDRQTEEGGEQDGATACHNRPLSQ